jgi:signal transduction histidine kinase/ActR/RegA family two-component response regulator
VGEFRAGRTVVLHDVRSDDRMGPGERERAAQRGVEAFIMVPLVKAGRPVAALVIHHAHAHAWTADEISLVEETAERTRAAVDQARAEAALRDSERHLARQLNSALRLHELSIRLIQGGDIRDLYEQMIDTAVVIMQSDFASLQAAEADNRLHLITHRGFHPESARHWSVVHHKSSICAVAMGRRERVVIPDVEDLVGLDQAELVEFKRSGIRSCQSTPLISRSGEMIGMISTHWREPRVPDESDLRMLDILARQIADLFERLKTERDLAASQKRYETLFETMNEGFVIGEMVGSVDQNPDIRLVSMNPAFERQTGLGIPLLVGRPVREAVPQLDPIWADELGRVVATGEAAHFEAPFGPQGRWFEVSAYRHAPGRFAAMLFDITQRRVAEEALRGSEEALREADRRKDEFLATLAHELRNPLAPIRNAVQLLKANGSGDSRLAWSRSVIERQLAQMARLLEDLLDMNRVSRGKVSLRRSRITLASVVDSAVETSRPLVDGGAHDLRIDLPPEPVLLDGDPVRLSQVLSNLLNNAAKYTPDGGHIQLRAVRDGNHVEISVSDTGIGILPEMLPKVFKMFSQMEPAWDRSHGGLGIGLSLVKRLIELHGGTIEARSEGLGKGSEFVVRLPVAEEEANVNNAPPVEERQSGRVQKLRILVVDDVKDSADSLAMLLRLQSHDVHVAYSGDEALHTIERARPDLVLLDIGMPGMNGYETCRRLRGQTHGNEIFVVALTGWGQEDDRRRSEEAGFDHHLVKPVNPADLVNLLESLPAERGSGVRS